MDVIRTYGNIIKNNAPEHPGRACRMICVGLALQKFRLAHFGDKRIPPAYRFLNTFAMGEVRDGIREPERTIWANLFSPVEILHCFDVHVASVECLSSFLSGFTIENYFLDYAEDEGIAPTLCSYHRNFIGAVDAGVIPPASYAVTTSTICDGNTNTFRYIGERHGVPTFLLDIPSEYTPESEAYVVGQTRALIAELEETFHKKLDYSRLSQILDWENESKACYERTLKMMKTKSYPSTMGLQMFMLFANHIYIGRPEILGFYRQMESEVAAAPEFMGTNIFWVHLLPYFQETLQGYFNLNPAYQIQGSDMGLDYREPLDPSRPLETLAKKMICNIYNAPYEKKADMVRDVVSELQSDGVINFCHWGCKQSSGGAMILKEKLQETGTPFLILDGDCVDRRNDSDGQIKTRLEAFLEMIDKQKGGAV